MVNSQNLHVIEEVFSLDNLSIKGRITLLVRDMLINFGDILPETSTSSACWDMAGNSNLKWLLVYIQSVCTPHMESDGTVLGLKRKGRTYDHSREYKPTSFHCLFH